MRMRQPMDHGQGGATGLALPPVPVTPSRLGAGRPAGLQYDLLGYMGYGEGAGWHQQ